MQKYNIFSIPDHRQADNRQLTRSVCGNSEAAIRSSPARVTLFIGQKTGNTLK
jgi:hypothetical protein